MSQNMLNILYDNARVEITEMQKSQKLCFEILEYWVRRVAAHLIIEI